MTPEQRKAHARMMSTLPVRTINAAGISRAEVPKPIEDKERPIVVHTRYTTMKSAASSQRVQVQTIREWIKSGRASFGDE